MLLASSAGALFGLAYTKPETWERFMAIPQGSLGRRAGFATLRAMALIFTLSANAVVAGWGVDILPHVPLFSWTAKLAPQPFAGVTAFAGQYLIPKGLEAIGSWRAPWSKA